jgi:uncharacterized membrane protein YbaN (DUF454 family)
MMTVRDSSSVTTPRRIGRTRRVLFFIAGSLALALGALGVLLPVLPTTPFVILAAFCYARSSQRAHSWLLANRVFGRHISDYLAGEGISWWVKAGVLSLLWATIAVSATLLVPFLWARVLLVAIGLAVTIHVLKLKTKQSADA